ncbi:MAG: S8 family serine peptidase [Candidatus Aminicenantia bacterium]
MKRQIFIPQKFIILILIAFFLLLGEHYLSNAQVFTDPYYLAPQIPKITSRLHQELKSLQTKDNILKIWIFFTDKGIVSQTQLKTELDLMRISLTDRSLKRRAKVRAEKNLVDYLDLPIFQTYVYQVSQIVKKVRTQSRWLNAISAEATSAQISEVAKLHFVRKIALVNSFRKNEPPIYKSFIKRGYEIPDFEYGYSWEQLIQIKVPKLHQLGYSGKGVLVCIMDSGFRKTHEVFQYASVVAEWDFVNGDNDVQYDSNDPNDYSDSHGTATWSVLGGYKQGELIGSAYGADFLLAKTEHADLEKPIEEDYWVAGVEWADSYGVDVVSSSLGYLDWYTFKDMDGNTAVTTIAADRAVSLGIVIVTAVGNERDTPWGHIVAPADGNLVIAVGAVDWKGRIAPFSSPGPTFDGRIKPEVCACGVDTYIAYNGRKGNYGYVFGSGTSFSTPLVAGVVALMLEIHPDWTPMQVRSALLNTASHKDHPTNDYGWGIVDAVAASQISVKKKIHRRR